MGIAEPSVNPSNQPYQTGSNDPEGNYIAFPSIPVAIFYDPENPVTLVPQPSGAAQAALTRGVSFGSLATIATSQSPAALGGTASTEVSMTVVPTTTGAFFQPATTDLVFLNKPTSQAGLGMGNVRVSAANTIGVTFDNVSATTITPTAGEKYGAVFVRGFTPLTPTLTPAAVLADSIVEQEFAVAGLPVGALVVVTKPTAQAGLDIAGARVVSADVLGITYINTTAATSITPTAEAYTVFPLSGLDSVSNLVTVEANVGARTLVASNTTAEQSVTLTGLSVNDMVVGVSKPTAQAGLGIVGWRVSAADALAVTYSNNTGAALTPTASEVYAVALAKSAAVAPLVVYEAALVPTGVAGNTTAEQLFTVTGVVASSPVVVNKPSPTTGLGILGARATSNGNQIGITFVNTTATTIVPPAETYLVGNFQRAIPDAGNAMVQPVSAQQTQAAILLNAIRAALAPDTGLNAIAGA